MDADEVIGCLRNKTVLITGSTGYLGKMLVEKILRVQPDVKKMYLLVRAPDAISAEQRVFSEIIGKDLFNPLREKHGPTAFEDFVGEKIVALAGDIKDINLGIHASQVDALSKEIDVIVNGAATTSFYERYDVALASNVFGARNACEFAKKCANLKMLLHVSTAGTLEGMFLEKAFHYGQTLRQGYYYLDIQAEFQLVEKFKSELTTATKGASLEQSEKLAMKELGLKRACHFGWPNVYALTKAMGEMIVGKVRGDLPVIIIRPSIVTSTYQDPFPGWIEGTRTVDALIVAYDEQALPCFIGDRKDLIDVIPADMVINAMLVAMAVHWNEKSTQSIYHTTSSIQNPLPGGVIEDACWDYFSANPRILDNGRALQNRRPYLFKRFAYFRLYLFLVYTLPLEMFHVVNLLFCGLFSQIYNKLRRRYNFFILLVKLYAPYAFFKARFDDTNLTRMRMAVKTDNDGDGNTFNFDPKCIDWHSYFLNVHVPAVLNYAHKKKSARSAKNRSAAASN